MVPFVYWDTLVFLHSCFVSSCLYLAFSFVLGWDSLRIFHLHLIPWVLALGVVYMLLFFRVLDVDFLMISHLVGVYCNRSISSVPIWALMLLTSEILFGY